MALEITTNRGEPKNMASLSHEIAEVMMHQLSGPRSTAGPGHELPAVQGFFGQAAVPRSYGTISIRES
jgi:hypothetical protein